MDDEIEDLNKVYTFGINVNDLGPLFHARYQFYNRHLRRWSFKGGWPYPQHPDDGFPERETITLEQQQEQRWARLQKDAVHLVAADSKSAPVLVWAQADKGTNEIIEKMTIHIRRLMNMD